MVTKINYSLLKGTGWGTDSISGLIAADWPVKIIH